MPGAGTVTLTVTDNVGGVDTATITVSSNSASSSAPASAGNSACPTAVQVTPVPPTIGQAFCTEHRRTNDSRHPHVHASQRECVRADPKQFQRYAARGDGDRQLCRTGFHLHRGERVVDQHLELDRIERGEHTAERQLHGHVERLKRCRRNLHQCRRGERAHDRSGRRQCSREPGDVDRDRAETAHRVRGLRARERRTERKLHPHHHAREPERVRPHLGGFERNAAGQLDGEEFAGGRLELRGDAVGDRRAA